MGFRSKVLTGLHYWAVIIDSLYHVGSWSVAALPGQFAEIEHTIIVSFFVTSGVVAVASGLARVFMRK